MFKTVRNLWIQNNKKKIFFYNFNVFNSKQRTAVSGCWMLELKFDEQGTLRTDRSSIVLYQQLENSFVLS